ncbi:hypothetical protein [Hahella ganghwensis]|uniref:hypothetical protein n=1 Tax=Hahella ganghwensis TaxID=286420 RepID=UPI00036306E8|nr:hypothetical protein [Hahella ganghwensis]
MVNVLDLKWLKTCHTQLREMAEDPDMAVLIVDVLNEDRELREELSHIYVRALRTVEASRKK